MEKIEKHIKSVIDEAKTLPFLFVGSGISKRYFNAPNWEELLKYIATRVFDNPLQYKMLIQKAQLKYDPAENYNQYMCYLADLLEIELIERWYIDDRFSEIRSMYSNEIENDVIPIKIEIANYLNSINCEKNIIENKKDEIEKLKMLKNKSISGIITTNYDTFLENIFEYDCYRSQNELLFNNTFDTHEIYKIHGCTNSPNTIAITSNDYQDIDSKNHYLAAKLLTIFMEHPIIFLGYGMGDEDIRKILGAIVDCLPEDKKKILEHRMIFVNWNPEIKEPVINSVTFQFEHNKSIAMTSIALNDYSKLYEILYDYKSKYPPKILRYLKKDMYSMFLNSEPEERLQVAIHANDQGEVPENVEYYFGFGIMELAKRGYKTITAEELFRDVLYDTEKFNHEYLVKESLPNLLPRFAYSLPMYKYIQDISEDLLPIQVKSNMKEKYSDFIPKSWDYETKSSTKNINSIINSDITYSKKFKEICMLKEHCIEVNVLGSFLKNYIDSTPDAFTDSLKSDLKRLIKIYDYLKYKKEPTMESVNVLVTSTSRE